MSRTTLRKRVDRLETVFSTTATTDDGTATTRHLDGTFTGTIRDGVGVGVRITRPLTFHRDADGVWLIYSWSEGRLLDCESIHVRDAVACDLLDAFFDLTADPDGFTGRTITGDNTD